jgi:hypothetical protein
MSNGIITDKGLLLFVLIAMCVLLFEMLPPI